ncbi:MAG TPA: 50S ribosomal L9 C-terminal domain-containing protein, partial [Bacteroidales bacterium]
IQLNEDHIKEVGQYKAVVKLHKNVKVEISLDVVAE